MTLVAKVGPGALLGWLLPPGLTCLEYNTASPAA